MRLGSYHEPHLLPVNLASVQAAAELRARVEPSSHALRFFVSSEPEPDLESFAVTTMYVCVRPCLVSAQIFFALEYY